MSSQVISHYKILKKLAAGGMGEIFLARDTKLNRTVTLKILPADVTSDRQRMRRFVQEAQATSALSHPNICVIHEVGETEDGRPFIAMEYIEGQPLNAKIGGRPMDPAEIVNVGIQVSDALDEAHSKGITHRDIKPANLMITPRGQVKVLDFGLAKVTKPVEQTLDSDAATLARTDPGLVMGTVPYMSPEQALGREVDHRTDIFSLGVVLYEMATGRLPFYGSNVGDIMDRIVHAQPEAIARFNYDIPTELERIIRKCLEKDRERRYQSARDLLVDLRNLKRDRDSYGVAAEKKVAARRSNPRRPVFAAASLTILALVGIMLYLWAVRGKEINSVAVLPLANASADPNTEYLSDGITESIINSLSQLPGLRVMARSTVFRYKGQEVDPQMVGRDLKVHAVLTGRVLQLGDSLVVKTELVDATNGSQLWGEQYNRKLSDIFAVQEEIAKQISEKLRLRLTGEERKRLTKRYTGNNEAYQAYLKGRYYWNKRVKEGLEKGIEYFEQAIEKDPNYALAYAGLADCYALLGDYGMLAPKESFPRAKAAAMRALEIDDTLAEAHTSLAHVRLYDWDWSSAEREYKRAIELNPNYATAHQWYANYLIFMGRQNEALAEIKRAQDIDPLSLIINEVAGWHLYLARQYDQAIEQQRKTLELDPNFAPAHCAIGLAYEQKGMYEKAIAEFQEAITLSGGSKDYMAMLGHAYAVSGNRGEAMKMLDELKGRSKQEYVPSYNLAMIYAGLGEKERALEWLEKAYEERSGWLIFLKVEPAFDNLRSDPRFRDLVRRVGIAP